MLADASDVTALGLHKLDALTVLDGWLQSPVVKAPACPNTRSGVVSPLPGVAVVASGLMYSNTRLLVASATKRLLLASTATPFGLHRLVELAATQLCVDVPVRPKTTAAAPPTQGKVLPHAANGALNSNTLLLDASETYILPLPTTATPIGPFIELR